MNEEGVYVVWLFINGIWREIVLDDYIPVFEEDSSISLAFSRSFEDELWVSLLEKAYAKAYGSYKAIEGGCLIETLRDLSGSPFKLFKPEVDDKDQIWANLVKANNEGSLMCVVIKDEV